MTSLTEKNKFRPPQIREGSRIYFYRNPGAWDRKVLAFVTRVGVKVLECYTIHGQNYEQVRHRDDPRVKDAAIAEFGCWDFTEDQKDYDRLLSVAQSLDNRLRTIEEDLERALQRATAAEVAARSAEEAAKKATTAARSAGRTGNASTAAAKSVSTPPDAKAAEA